MINTVKIQGGGYLLNGNMSVPKADGNSDYEAIKIWLAEGNIPTPEFTQVEIDKIAKDKAKQQALTDYNASITAMIGQVPHTELVSWAKQETEARNLAGLTPLIDRLIVSRGLGETREELAAKIIANADAYAIGYAQVLGAHQAKLKAIV